MPSPAVDRSWSTFLRTHAPRSRPYSTPGSLRSTHHLLAYLLTDGSSAYKRSLIRAGTTEVYRRELSRRRLLLAVSPAAGHLTSPTVAGLPGLCENFRPTTSKSSPILRLLSSHWATSVVRTRVIGVANVGDSLRRLSSLQHRIYNLLGRLSCRSCATQTWR